VLTGAGDLFAQRRLALVISSDPVVVGDGEDESCDRDAELPAELARVNRSFLDRVVQRPCCDDVVGLVSFDQQRGDLDRVKYERSPVDLTPLPAVGALGVPERLSSLRKSRR
jgi:hypothetical protein